MFARALARRGFDMRADAISGAERAPDDKDAWRAIDPEPRFGLTTHDGAYPTGLSLLTIAIEPASDEATPGWLHVACETGEERRFRLPPPKLGRVEHLADLPQAATKFDYLPFKGEGRFRLGAIQFRETSLAESGFRRFMEFWRAQGLSPLGLARLVLNYARATGPLGPIRWVIDNARGEADHGTYRTWLDRNDAWTPARRARAEELAREAPPRTRFSIIMPVHDTPEKWLRAAIDSVIAQAWPHWELCICDDRSSKPRVRAILESYRRMDERIKLHFRPTNGHISQASNDALAMATSEYICLLDHDDILAPDALLEFARALHERPELDMIYSDEDKITTSGLRYDPFFKPDWSPELLESGMYVRHFCCYKTTIAREIGGFRGGFDGAQDYDFALRFSERAGAIGHVRKILYHWRALPNSTATSIDRKNYVVEAGRRALADRFEREGGGGQAINHFDNGIYEPRREIEGSPLVSIIVSAIGNKVPCARTNKDDIAGNLRSHSTYETLEIILVEATALRRPTSLPATTEINQAVATTRGKYILFLDANAEIVTSDWIENMLRVAQRPGVGAVGARLLYGDDTLRHTGLTFRDGLPRPTRRGFGGSDRGYFGATISTRNCLAVSGACMMVARAAFDAVGGFQPDASAYPDADLCLRLHASGLRNVHTPWATLRLRDASPWDATPDEADAAAFRARWLRLTDPDPYYGSHLTLKPPTFEFDPDS